MKNSVRETLDLIREALEQGEDEALAVLHAWSEQVYLLGIETGKQQV